MADLTDEAVKALADAKPDNLFVDQDEDVCIDDGRQFNLIFCPARDDGPIEAGWAVLNPDVVAELVTRYNMAPDLARALLDARAELAQARADTDAAVALVVEQCAKGADRRYAAGDMGNPGHHIRALAPADGLAMVQELRAEIADLKMNMDADLRTMVREGQQLRTLAAELAAAQQREAELLAALEDPLVVHLNMVAGKIAKPLPSQLAHIYGEDVIRAALAPTPPADTWHERRTMLPDGDARKGEG